MDRLIEILAEIKPGVDFTQSKGIVDEALLSSIEILKLVKEINDEFDIEISVSELIPENFNSLEAMLDMIEKLEEE